MRRGAVRKVAPRLRSPGWALLVLALAGCRPATAPVPRVLHAVYVDLAALRDLHHAWPVITAVARDPAIEPASPAAPDADEPARPPRLVRPAPLPDVPPDRAAGANPAGADVVESLRAALEARDARTIARERQVLAAKAERDMAEQRAALEARRRTDEARLEADAVLAERKRALSEIHLRSQIAILTGPVRQGMQSALEALLAERLRAPDALKQRRRRLATELDAALRTGRESAAASVARQVAAKQAALAADTNREVAEYVAGMRRSLQSEDVPGAAAAAASPPLVRSRAPASPREVAAFRDRGAAPAGARGDSAADRAAQARVGRLVDTDMRALVEACAAERGWQVWYERGAGRPDATAAVRDWLRREMRQP